jgi:hypothetical protein
MPSFYYQIIAILHVQQTSHQYNFDSRILPSLRPTSLTSSILCSSSSARAILAAHATAPSASVSSSARVLSACRHTRTLSIPFGTVGQLIGRALSPEAVLEVYRVIENSGCKLRGRYHTKEGHRQVWNQRSTSKDRSKYLFCCAILKEVERARDGDDRGIAERSSVDQRAGIIEQVVPDQHVRQQHRCRSPPIKIKGF